MRAKPMITPARREEILTTSIQRQLRATVTLRLAEGWRTYKAQFVSGSLASARLMVRMILQDKSAVSERPKTGDALGVTFRWGHKKCMFTSDVQSMIQDDKGMLLTLSWPDDLQQLQRRAYERAAPPRGTVIAVRFWLEESDDEHGQGRSNMHHGQLEDLSAGGLRIKTADLAGIELDRTYRCVFTPRAGAPAVIVNARLRQREAADQGRASLGFQFLGLETTAEGRRVLARIARLVSQFQRGRGRRLPSRPPTKPSTKSSPQP